MEYLVGFFVGTTLIVLAYRFVIKNMSKPEKNITISYSQSHIFDILKPFASMLYKVSKPGIKTQTSEYEKSQTVKVIMTENQAYWIRDNVFYTADITEDYSVDNDSTRIVDTMSMDRVQLDKMIFIVDRLTEDSENDGSNSRNTWL
jgi:hypothetical protein